MHFFDYQWYTEIGCEKKLRQDVAPEVLAVCYSKEEGPSVDGALKSFVVDNDRVHHFAAARKVKEQELA